MKRKRATKERFPDVRPLDQRMSQDKAKELRKGIARTQETVNIDFTEHQCKLPLFGDPYKT